jgi:prepilin-type N-terminal cleavage/methylation domain-containing protein
MFKRKNNKKGFTVVELTIVVSVIAILSAVLIPTFASITKRARLSADEQAVRQMNLQITTTNNIDTIDNLEEAMNTLDEAGYNALDTLVPVSKNHAFYWDNENKSVVLVNTKDNTVVYPQNYKSAFNTAWANLRDDGVKEMSNINVANISDLREVLDLGAKKVTLTQDLNLKDSITIENTTVIDLNGKDLDASKNDSRPFNVDGNANLTIKATNSEVKTGKYGLINVVAGSNATVTLNGGTYIADEDSDNGAFIKVRAGATANITLNNVIYKDHTNQNYVVNADGAVASLTVTGGEYKGKGFQATASSTFTDVKIETTSVTCIEVSGGNVENNTTVISGCTFTAPASAWACVTASYNAVVTVTNCTIVSGTDYAILPTGGSITVDGVAVTKKVE